MLADIAVAVNPDDERYRDLVGKTAILPLVGRELPIIADDYVKTDFGTGALKITPGHDPNDFEIGRRHGLPTRSRVIGEDGRMTRRGRRAVRRADGAARRARRSSPRSRRRARIRHARALHPQRARSATARGERIEPLISLQWFMRMDELAKPAIEAVERGPGARSTPSRRRAATSSGCSNIRPWCVSRQLWWGHQLPVWYRGDEETYVGASRPRATAGTRDPDVLDTWFSLGAVAVRDARLARRDAASCAPSTRPTCSSPRATSSSCGSRGW